MISSLSKLFKSVVSRLFDQVGQHNPQLLREWRGRLRWRNLLLTLILSVTVQGLVLLQRLVKLVSTNPYDNPYCLEIGKDIQSCQMSGGFPVIDWTLLWADIFRDLSYVVVWVLIVAGVYLLAADLAKESRRGTLNFLRMSPLPGRQILKGKLLGTPVLLYVGITSMVPLHIATGLLGSYSPERIVSFYVLLGAIAFFYYTAALWFSLVAQGLQGLQTWLISGLSTILLFLGWVPRHSGDSLDWFRLFNPLHILADWQVKGLSVEIHWPFEQGRNLHGFRELGWFFLPIGYSGYLYMCLAIANALVLGGCFWMLLNRKFQTPTKAAIGKRQSYGLTLCTALIVMGFNLQQVITERPWSHFTLVNQLETYITFMTLYALVLMVLLLPTKQVLLDWARYAHRHSGRRASKRLKSLMFQDGSPSVLAFAINLSIVASVLLLGIALSATSVVQDGATDILLFWGCCGAVLLVCALAIQLISLSNLLHWRWVALGTVAAITLGWPVALAMLNVNSAGSLFQSLWLTTLFAQVADPFYSVGACIALTVQLGFIAGLSRALMLRCQYLGQSEWKALMANAAH